MTGVRTQLAAACAAVAMAVPFVAIANASVTVGDHHQSTPIVVDRQSRTSGVGIAGGSVYIWSSHLTDKHGGACTMGFAVRSRVTGAAGVLTAGHCVGTLSGGPSYVIHQTENLPPDGTDPGPRVLARVHRGGYRMGKNGDSALAIVTSGSKVRPDVFIGGTRSKLTIPVTGVEPARYGMHVCYSGAASGEHCGFTVGGPRSVQFEDGDQMITIQHEYSASRPDGSCTSVKGDSGSPVYVRQDGTAIAVGILSGGQKVAGTCPFFFTPVSLALSQLDVSLVRAKS